MRSTLFMATKFRMVCEFTLELNAGPSLSTLTPRAELKAPTSWLSSDYSAIYVNNGSGHLALWPSGPPCTLHSGEISQRPPCNESAGGTLNTEPNLAATALAVGDVPRIESRLPAKLPRALTPALDAAITRPMPIAPRALCHNKHRAMLLLRWTMMETLISS